MNVQVEGNEQLTQLLNEWYLKIRARDMDQAIYLKETIEAIIQDYKENQNSMLYYYLLDFRHNYLINNLGVSKESFDIIDTFVIPKDNFLSYYYYFLKQSTIMPLAIII